MLCDSSFMYLATRILFVFHVVIVWLGRATRRSVSSNQGERRSKIRPNPEVIAVESEDNKGEAHFTVTEGLRPSLVPMTG